MDVKAEAGLPANLVNDEGIVLERERALDNLKDVARRTIGFISPMVLWICDFGSARQLSEETCCTCL